MTARIALLALLIPALVLGACGSSAPTEAPASPAGSSQPGAPSAAASPSGALPPGSPAASDGPSSSAASPEPAGASASPGSSGAVDLRALLPDTVGGHRLATVQYSGRDFGTLASVSKEMTDLLSSLGRTPRDMTLAAASDPSQATDLSVTAFQVRDVPVAAFVAAYLPMLKAAYGQDSVTQGTRAGKAVYTVARQGLPTQILLSSGDVLFVVSATDAALVDEALAALP